MAKGVGVKIRSIYGKPLVKPNTPIPLSRDALKQAARIILKAVKKELQKDIAKARGLNGGTFPTKYAERNPVPIPANKKFVDSFKVRLRGRSTIEVYSTWPTVKNYIKQPKQRDLESPKKGPIKPEKGIEMTWLMQPKVKYVPIVTTKGEVIIRTAPSDMDKVWIHPGFLKYTFLERGVKKGRLEAGKVLAEQAVEALLKDFSLVGSE